MCPAPLRGELGPAATEATPQQGVGPYLRAVSRHRLFVVLVTLLTAGVATFTALRSGQTYQASASVLVSPVPQGAQAFVGTGVVLDTGDPARTVQTAVALIESAQGASAAALAMGPGWTSQRVQSAVAVTPLGQSEVVSITAKGSTPTQAARLANTYARAAVGIRGAVVQHNVANELAALQARVAALPRAARSAGSQPTDLSTSIDELNAAKANGGDPTLSISQAAQPPTSPTGAARWLVTLLSLVGGFALASVGALGLEFFSRPVRDEEELTTFFDAPILASIPLVRRSGPGPLSPLSLPPGAFEPVRMLRVQLEMAEAPVIMVTSAGAGDGKTTLVAALAAAFSEGGQDVILMDLDLRRPSLAKVLDAASHESQPENPDDPEQFLRRLAFVPGLPNVKLLPFPAASMSSIGDVMARLPPLLAQARRAAGCVIVDTAPVGEVSESLRIASMCDTVVFVVRPRHTDRRRLVLARDLLARAGAPLAGIVLVGGASNGRSYGHYDRYGHAGPNGVAGNGQTRTGQAQAAAGRIERRDA